MCPVCKKNASTKDEKLLNKHLRRGSVLCEGSGASVEGLKFGTSSPYARTSMFYYATICVTCNERAYIDLDSGLVYPHLNPVANERCSLSGRRPRHDLWMEAVSVPAECPTCHATVIASRGHGLVYEHTTAKGKAPCEGSGARGLVPEGEGKLIKPAIRPLQRPIRERAPSFDVGLSVHTVSGGLPSHGRRY
jgi:hypothetical protein